MYRRQIMSIICTVPSLSLKMFQDIELLYGKNPNFPPKIKLAVEGLHIKKICNLFSDSS